MLVDCARCVVRGDACSDCVISVILDGAPRTEVELDPTERRALSVLADYGLVPPLRHDRLAG